MPSPSHRLASTIAAMRHALDVAAILAETEPEAAREVLTVAVKRAQSAARPRP
jgi:hypothetical protein